MPEHDPEAEYFARLDREKKAKLAEELAAQAALDERERLRALHQGRCARCGGAFKPQRFRGVEIDVCDDCGSVLLDPGELQELAGKDESGALAPLVSLFAGFRKKG